MPLIRAPPRPITLPTRVLVTLSCTVLRVEGGGVRRKGAGSEGEGGGSKGKEEGSESQTGKGQGTQGASDYCLISNVRSKANCCSIHYSLQFFLTKTKSMEGSTTHTQCMAGSVRGITLITSSQENESYR